MINVRNWQIGCCLAFLTASGCHQSQPLPQPLKSSVSYGGSRIAVDLAKVDPRTLRPAIDIRPGGIYIQIRFTNTGNRTIVFPISREGYNFLEFQATGRDGYARYTQAGRLSCTLQIQNETPYANIQLPLAPGKSFSIGVWLDQIVDLSQGGDFLVRVIVKVPYLKKGPELPEVKLGSQIATNYTVVSMRKSDPFNLLYDPGKM